MRNQGVRKATVKNLQAKGRRKENLREKKRIWTTQIVTRGQLGKSSKR
jgi:hypothetical protein